jgi:hypothetical protein
MNSDTSNKDGGAQDIANAPIAKTSIKGLWREVENNKIAAGKKYAGHRLMFIDETVDDSSGMSSHPSIEFVGYNDGNIIQSVIAGFSGSDGARIDALKKGSKVTFICEQVDEPIEGGYSLGWCSLR